MSHLRTIPLAAWNFGTSYGQARTQYWHPKHWSSRWLTIPVIGSFSYALTGQAFKHAGSRQWWQAVVTCWSTGSAAPEIKSPTSRQTSPSSRPFSEWQAATHALQPEQRSRSTSKAYCCPGPGGFAGKSDE